MNTGGWNNDYQTIKVRFQDTICFIKFNRPEANNTINEVLIEECRQVLEFCEESATIVVLEGLPKVFCFGADFQGIRDKLAAAISGSKTPNLCMTSG